MDSRSEAAKSIDRWLAEVSQFAKRLPKILPENVLRFPNRPFIDRAPLPMNMAFHELAKFRNGRSVHTVTLAGEDHIWTPTKEQRAYFQQRYPEKSFHALGEPFVIVDNTKPSRRRLHPPEYYLNKKQKAAAKTSTHVLKTGDYLP